MARKEIAAARFARTRIIKQRTCEVRREKIFKWEIKSRREATAAASQIFASDALLCSPLIFRILITHRLDGNSKYIRLFCAHKIYLTSAHAKRCVIILIS